jgi:uncharacterized lipoprotein YddW (UPF0748 family)
MAAVIAVSAVTLLVGLVAVILVGRGRPAAGPPPPSGVCGSLPTHAARDLRGMTLTTVFNRDWPSQGGLGADRLRAEYLDWLDLAVAQRHNAIFVQVRPNGDAFWPSEYAPWSEWLTGNRSGADPGWDPLEFMIEEAHARNIEFHGWFNPYFGSARKPRGGGADMDELAPGHVLLAHPEWAVRYGVGTSEERLYVDPGIPEARRYIEDSILEAVAKYDLDGVFFDDFFYPYPGGGPFDDAATFARYGGGMSRADWRRSNVDTLVREMNERVKQLKPWVKFGISPFGIWRNARNGPVDGVRGSDTTGLSAYDEIYADSRTWVREEWVDYIMPQLYWHIGRPGSDYAKLVPWWSEQIEGTRVHLYTAHADYLIGEPSTWSRQRGDDKAWSIPGQIDKQLSFNEDYPVSGSVHFTASSVRNDRLEAVTQYRDAHYARPALPPTMPHLPVAAPGPPALLESNLEADGAVTLRWRPADGAPTVTYAVYRYGEDSTAAELVAKVRAAGPDEVKWTDKPGAAGPYGYCVSGLDRSWNEGPASAPITVTL